MRIDYEKLAPGAARALFSLSGIIRRSVLEDGLRELVSVLVSQLNGCAHCIAVHWEKARGEGVAEEKLRLVTTFEESGRFSAAEKAALRLSRALTAHPAAGISDDLWREVAEELGEEAALYLVHQIMLMNAWNRLSIALALPPPGE
ncbi:MAG: carboxymuconolactone decarboxylase family protein [Spirochaetales bacterium]|nr:carboxymuconolactone decarboxylase family protein [Spirochaetales bacterium]